jgi:ATP-binding protein involved in chromosome partitioning
LAVALSRVAHPAHGVVSRALRVGLMDGDVYGPSVPILMNLAGLRAETRQAGEREHLVPLENYGIRCMSMGFLMDDKAAAIWRGPMVSSAIQQLLFMTDWGQLDVLVVDLPPGTGDAQLSLVQSVPLSGAVVVSTPQLVALADVRRAVAMFNKVKTPVLGVLENMSSFECPKCGSVSHIFGKEGAVREAETQGVPLLGQVPLSEHVRQLSDDGRPVTVVTPEHAASRVFAAVAQKVTETLFTGAAATAAAPAPPAADPR